MFNSLSRRLGETAEQNVGKALQMFGWDVQYMRSGMNGAADLVIHKGALRYAVEVKALSEGRPDRVLPLLSQAILQAQFYSASDPTTNPLAVIYVENASSNLWERVKSFADQYAPGVAVGIVSGNGVIFFKGEGLDGMSERPRARSRQSISTSTQPINIFSDLNQWMLKVLLAPELPPELLSAPRGHYRGGSDLAKATGVSAMSASRFLLQLRQEGYLSESAEQLKLVRRDELFHRWRAAAMRRPAEIPVRFRIKAPVQQQIRGLLKTHPRQACLGLFAAADGLGLGHVGGIPPYVYLSKLPPSDLKTNEWAMLMSATEGLPDLILRQALTPQSMMRGAVVRDDGLMYTDVIQVWLDVANHPSRGQEQADLIWRKTLQPLLGT